MKRVIDLAGKSDKLVVGLMSGTSADGVDAVLVRLRGHGLQTKVEMLAFETLPYSERMREAVLEVGTGPVSDLCRMNFVVGERFAEAALCVIQAAGFAAADVDLVGSHGQTVYHVPRSPGEVASTLQIGEPDVIAERLGIPVVADFRTRDVAAGGEGAPLSAYVDYLLFHRDQTPRALLNLGGIANVTVVTEDVEEVFAFDTGPANMPLDETIRAMTGNKSHYDKGGRQAAKGRVDENLLARLLEHPYFQYPIPKTTGRETFGRDFVMPLLHGKGNNRSVDVLATLTLFVAQSIKRAFDEFVFPRASITQILASGGGVHNLTLVSHLRRLFGKLPIMPVEEVGYDGDAKEALLFAILANDTIHGIPNNIPGATGARWPTTLGKISP
ncbi:MAG: anhydro-N-acetylmuramic acid kinase [Planctomycetota bacterium]|jgi:anhydro-N-acetylmuramic acid kinase